MIQSYSKYCHNLGAILETKRAESGSLEHLGKATVVTLQVLYNQEWSFESRRPIPSVPTGLGKSPKPVPRIQLPSGTPHRHFLIYTTCISETQVSAQIKPSFPLSCGQLQFNYLLVPSLIFFFHL